MPRTPSETPAVTAPLVIACCSSDKAASPCLDLAPVDGEPLADGLARWRSLVAKARGSFQAGDLYRGRAFRIAAKAAEMARAEFAVVSAGLGVVERATLIPSYDLTTEAGDRALARRYRDWSAATWWRGVRDGPFATPLCELVERHSVTLIALTQPYARLIRPELDALGPHVAQLRLFGRGLARFVPETLVPAIMPYDRRLDALGKSGTDGDFAARALADFLGSGGPSASLIEDAARVSARLAMVDMAARVANPRVDDAAILTAISSMRRHDPRISIATLRRRLRHEARLACSDARLRRLVAQR